MKNFIKFILGLLVLVVAAIVILPKVIDVDRYRPQITQAINEKIQGSAEVGKLSLSLWGQVRVEVGGLKLLDAHQKEVLSVSDAYFHLPFLSVFSGAPVLTFKMNQPKVNVIKDRAGNLNLMSLVKKVGTPGSTTGTSQAPDVPSPNSAAPSSSSTSLPAILANAKLGVELSHASLNYQDELTNLKSEVKDLNILLKDMSLTRPTEIEIWANLDTQMGKTLRVRGPVKLTGTATPELSRNAAEKSSPQVQLNTRLDLASLEIEMPGIFEKKAGVSADAQLKMVGSETEVKIDSLVAHFHNAELKAKGTVSKLNSEPILNLQMQTNEVQLKPWEELIPSLKGLGLTGSAGLDVTLGGTSKEPKYQGKFVVNGVSVLLSTINATAKTKLKAAPVFDGVVNFSTNKVDHMAMSMKAPGNDLKVQGQVVSFTRPKVDLNITSSGMDLDQLIEFPPPAQKTNPKGEGQSPTTDSSLPPIGSPPGKNGNPPLADYDQMLSPLRENKILAATEMSASLDMKFLKAYQVKMSQVVCKMNFKDLGVSFDSCGFQVFSGKILAGMKMGLKSPSPSYSFTSQVSGLDMAQAIESQIALFKNTLKGKAEFSIQGQGSSFNPDKAMMNFQGRGKMKVVQATFATIDIMKMVKEVVEKSLTQVSEKIPALKGPIQNQVLNRLPNHESRYAQISSDFTIANQKFQSPNFVAQAVPNEGIDFKGSTAVGLKDKSLDTTWEVTDTYNLTHLKDLSVEQSGVTVPHLLAEGNSPIHFTVHAGCTILAPCYSYTEVPGQFAKIAASNLGKALAGKAKDELKKKAGTLIEQMAPKQLPSNIKDQLKGLFH